MYRKAILVTTLFLIVAFDAARSQDIQFSASAKSVVAEGETFTLSYTVVGQATGFKGPRINGFEVLSGPNSSTMSSIRAINGRTSMTITTTYTYLLQAVREGSYDIPAATVTIDQKSYNSNVVTIRVVKNTAGSGNSQSAPQGSQSQQGQSAQSGSNDVFVKAFVSNASPVMGEGVIATYKIFTRVQIAQLNINKISSFQGFWSQNLLNENDKLVQSRQTIDGELYTVAEIRKVALFPLKSGKLVIEPLELECLAQIRRQTKTKTGDPFFDDFFNDSFFSNSYATIEKKLKSNSLVVNVRPLPTEKRPADFGGAVGNFTFNSSVDKTQYKTNDPITFKFTVTGSGNIQLIDKLPVSFPPDFEAYDPKVTSNVNTTSAGVSGSQVFEYLVIPRKPGKFIIKPVPFTYYDLNKKQYVTLLSAEYTLDIARGSGDQSAVTYSGAGKEDIQYIGSDIRFIVSKPFTLHAAGTRFFGSAFYFLLLAVPLVLFVLMWFYWRKELARRSDTTLMKNRKATRVAIKRLRKAEGFLKQGKQDPFYEEIYQALWGYLSDKFGIPLSELSADTVNDMLKSKNVSEALIGQFSSTLNETEFARFAPGDKILRMDETYQKALEIISRIERELR
jgi:hypothetical protein